MTITVIIIMIKVFSIILPIKVCEALLDGGADPAAQSGEECTVLHYLVQVRLGGDDDDCETVAIIKYL